MGLERSAQRARGFVLAMALLALLPRVAFAQSEPDAALDAALHKANTYIEVANMTVRAVESWERYQSWVNMKTGPTGKERYISYGLYEVSNYEGLVIETRALNGKAPASPDLDAAVADCLERYEDLRPIINEAAAYYDSAGYESDKADLGQKLHKTLAPLLPPFIDAREKMLTLLRPFARGVEAQEIAAIEARDGRTAKWHVRNIMLAATRVTDTFPHQRPQPMTSEMLEQKMSELGPDSSGAAFDEIMMGVVPPQTTTIDVEAYDAALDGYATAVAGLEAGIKGEAPEDFDEFKPLPAKLLELFKAFQPLLSASGGKEFDGAGQMANQIVQAYFNLTNEGNSIEGGRVRFLP
jgi:hypothetical protein